MTQSNPSSSDTAAKASQYYSFGETTVFASEVDPRFPYCLYVPPTVSDPNTKVDLVIAVHGTARQFTEYRSAFSEFGRWHNCIVLCPLFPAGVRGDGNRDGFKHIREGEIRYDEVLLGMVREIEQKYGRSFAQFALFGFSGGGQFVNRFAYLHPDRLWAASIGAPGSVTLLDSDRDWWVGVRDIKARFGKPLDLASLRRVPVHMVVGKFDLDTWEITHTEKSPHFMPGANDAGRTRRERIETLRQSFVDEGIDVQLDVVDNVSHQGLLCVEPVQSFFAKALQQHRAAGAPPAYRTEAA